MFRIIKRAFRIVFMDRMLLISKWLNYDCSCLDQRINETNHISRRLPVRPGIFITNVYNYVKFCYISNVNHYSLNQTSSYEKDQMGDAICFHCHGNRRSDGHLFKSSLQQFASVLQSWRQILSGWY